MQRLGDGPYGDVLARHHEIVRAGLDRHGGREEGTQGDSFFAVFTSTTACLSAALEIQRSLAAQSWPEDEPLLVRMGVHTGEASDTSTGLVGYEVHRAARVAAVAHGGQILLSASAASLVNHSLPEGVTVRALGEHRLKDLGQPESLFQVVATDLPSSFPPLRSLDNVEFANNLPTSLSPFIGRRGEIAEVKELVRLSHLVTLTGAGGSGKTRLALQVAAELLDGTGEGVWFVRLDAISDPELVPLAVVESLELKRDDERPSSESLATVLKDQDVLIVLDNCEHVIDAVAKLADLIGRQCPKVRLVATSREPLGVEGEEVCRVRSLSLPEGPIDGVEDLVGYDAIDLFVARARSHDKTFVTDDASAMVLTSVCRRLDGIPLAIELAAARLSSMSLDDLAKRLDQRFRLLTGGSRNSLPRQQTLGAMVAWSYDLLSEPEREVLRRLTVFVGGFDLDAVEAVCSSDALAAFETVDIVGSLANKSLVVVERTTRGVRYRLLETIRQFAIESLLMVDGDVEASDLRRRHAAFYLSLAERAEPSLLGGPEQALWFFRLDDEWDNLQAAFATFAHEDEHTELLRLAAALTVPYLLTRRSTLPIPAVLAALDATSDAPVLLRVRSLLAANELLAAMTFKEGQRGSVRERQRQIVDEVLGVVRALPDRRLLVEALTAHANLLRREDQVPATDEALREAEAVAEELGDERTMAWAKFLGGRYRSGVDGDELIRAAVVHFRRAQDATGLATALHITAVRLWVDALLGDARLAESVTVEEEVIEVALSIRDDLSRAAAVGNIGIVLFAAGNAETGEEYLRQCLISHRRLGEPAWTASCVVYLLGNCWTLRGDARLGARLFGAAQVLEEQMVPHSGYEFAAVEIQMRDLHKERLRSELGASTFQSEVTLGRTLPYDEVYRLALGRRR